MKLQVKSFFLAALLALAAVSTPALSQDTDAYVGFNVGQSKVMDFDCTGTTSCDDKATAWSIFGGLKLTKNFGLELGYVDFGKASQSAGTDSLTYEATAFELSGVWTLPISESFSVYGKLGFFMWNLDVNVTSSTLGSGSLSEHGNDYTFGAGVRWNFTKSLTAQLQWQKYNNVGDTATTGKSDIDIIGAGILFRF